MSAFEAPKDIWEVKKLLGLDDPLAPDDPRYVDLADARGHFSFNRLLKDLGVKPETMELVSPSDKDYLVFCGHRGCGKSTELRRLSHMLNRSDLFFVVWLDATKDLDVNNLHYTDVFMGLASALFKKLQNEKVRIGKSHLNSLNAWFFERIKNQVVSRDFSAGIESGAEAKPSLPFIGNLFAKITNSFKINSTYKDELRRVIQNNFSEFAHTFNQFLSHAEEKIGRGGKGQKILFVVDGTDRLKGDDSQRFFIQDTHQLQAITANFIYCGPVHLLYEGYQVHQIFKPYILPMIKLYEKDGSRNSVAHLALENLVLKRADLSLFDSKATLDTVIAHSGGNPRELLRILRFAFSLSDTERFDPKAVKGAIQDIAIDFKRFLKPQDYQILYAVDHDLQPDWDTERELFLLYHLALLEYNGTYWRRSHPAIRTLEEYQRLGEV